MKTKHESNVFLQLEFFAQQNENLIYQKIAEHLLNNFNSNTKLKVRDVAKQCHCSLGMVTKFTKKLGYQNFNSLCFDLKQYSNQNQLNFKHQKNLAANNAQLLKIQTTTNTYYRLVTDSLQYTHLQNGINVFYVTQAIKKTSTIYLFGIGANFHVCSIFANYLMKCGYNVFWSTDYDVQKTIAANIKTDGLAIIFSYSGLTPQMVEIF